MATNRDNDSVESPAPPRLIEALRQTQSRHVFVPRTIDEVVLRTARQHFASAQRRGPNTFALLYRWLAFGTACVLMCAAAFWLTLPRSSRNRAPAYDREDINRDGRVDILDAFQLARQLQSGERPEPTLDLNNDGLVDHRDADTIAAQAVKLEKGRRS